MPRGISRYDERLLQQVIPRIGQQVVNYPNINDPYFANVSLLLHGDGINASRQFYDSSLFSRNLTVAGNATISNAQSKFGGGSFSTGATTGANCLSAAASASLQMMDGNFTIEAWFLPNAISTGTERTFYAQGLNTAGGLSFFVGTGGARFRANSQTDLVYSGTISSSVFTHIAFVRNGNTRLIFVDGTQVASDTLSFNNNDLVTLEIGAPSKNAADAFRFFGNIDDFRITKGVARYTANFTVPDAPFPDFGS